MSILDRYPDIPKKFGLGPKWAWPVVFWLQRHYLGYDYAQLYREWCRLEGLSAETEAKRSRRRTYQREWARRKRARGQSKE